MNAQEIFDKVVTHLFTQGVKSKNESNEMCLYRGPNNTSCAVGYLIPDEMYVKAMDGGYNVTSLIEDGSFKLPDYFGENVKLLKQLQRFHDEILGVKISYNQNNINQLEIIADNFDLNFDKVKFDGMFGGKKSDDQ